MEQHIRIARITNLIEIGRMHAQVRHGMLGKPEVGIPVNDELTVWGEIPADAEEDSAFAAGLLERAKKAAAR